jgi:hypothetical protein
MKRSEVKDHNPDAGDSDTWESARVNVKRPVTAVISVRMPRELVVSVESFAQTRSLSVSDVVRLATERLMQGVEQAPTFAVVGTAEYQLKLAGPTVMIYAVTLGAVPIRSKLDQPPYLPAAVQ